MSILFHEPVVNSGAFKLRKLTGTTLRNLRESASEFVQMKYRIVKSLATLDRCQYSGKRMQTDSSEA